MRGRIDRCAYLDIGCGPNTRHDFINLDYDWHSGIDACWDVTKGLPFEDESLDGIFTEHCFEHLPFTSMPALLGECHRVLRPGGSVRIIVPDCELLARQYVDLLSERTKTPLPHAEHHSVDGIYAPAISVNRLFREHGHQFIYDFDTMQRLLVHAGFVGIQKENYGSGRDPNLLNDTRARAIESLYVEASKDVKQVAQPQAA